MEATQKAECRKQKPAPARASIWQLRTRSLPLPARPLLMGIVNVTPDSFSDGGRFYDPQAAVEQALICKQTSVPVSIDTSKAAVARAAVDAGVEIINDVTGFTGDHEMLAIAQSSGVGVCAMHMQGTPQTMQDNPTYRDVVTDILHFLLDTRDMLESGGIAREKICLDPGIGFGKTHEHNLTLLANCWRFHELGCPVLVGHSRKGFIAHVLGDKCVNRCAGTIGVACALAGQGVQLLRVHDAGPVKQALQLFEAVGGIST
jgi:dihydropteroate synthase